MTMKSRYTHLIAYSLIAVLFIAVPLTSFAKNNGNGNGNGNGKGKANKEEKKQDKDQKKITKSASAALRQIQDDDKSCWRAFGHLIAPGWIKHNGPVDVGLECNLPPGIAKKLRGGNASTTPDTTAPVISAILAAPGIDSARIMWATNERATSKVYYSTTAPVVPGPGVPAVSNSAPTTFRTLTLSGLSSGTTYYYVIESADAAGNVARTSSLSFTTAPVSTSTPPVISMIGETVGSTTASITWKTAGPSTSLVLYSTSTPVNPVSALAASSSAPVLDHEIHLSGLATSTTYFYTVTSTNNAGTYSVSGNSFLTEGD